MDSPVSDPGSSYADCPSSLILTPVNFPSYASVISMDTAASGADLTHDDSHDLLSEAHNAIDDKMPTVERDLIHTHNIFPQRPLSAFLLYHNRPLTLLNTFADLKDIGINSTAVKCLQRTSLGNYRITFLNEDNRNTF